MAGEVNARGERERDGRTRRSRIEDRGSRIEDRGSRSEDRGARIEERAQVERGGREGGLSSAPARQLFAHHLIRIASYQARWDTKREPNIYFSGLIAAPGVPASMIPKGSSRPSKVAPPGEYDRWSAMRIHRILGGGELHMESVF